MPPELGSALSIEREPVTDPDIRVQTLEAIYLIILEVKHFSVSLSLLVNSCEGPIKPKTYKRSSVMSKLLLMLQEAGRRAFWSVNGPRILQLGYEYEEDPKAMRAYEQVGSLVCSLPLISLTD